MTSLERSLRILAFTLRVVGDDQEHAVFGSASLRLRGIIDREPGDVDVFVSRRVWGLVLARTGWRVLTPNAGDPPILAWERSQHPIHLFFDWRDVAVAIDVPAVIADGELVGGLRCCPVEEVLRHKRAALAWGTPGTAKHRPDVAVIEAWLEARAA